MDDQRAKILNLISTGITSISEERFDKEKITLTSDLILFGEAGELDSLELVSLVVDLEESISELFDKDISLTDDRAISLDKSPFTNQDTLATYIELLLSE